jgi:DNA-binding transcriptional ArsR family regulator
MVTTSEPAFANLFFALGDRMRLSIVRRLVDGGAATATALSDGAAVTRQAIVKHLQVLERSGLVRRDKRGREVLYAVEPRRLEDARAFLDTISLSRRDDISTQA